MTEGNAGDLIACSHHNGSYVHIAFVLHPLVLEPVLGLSHSSQTNQPPPLHVSKLLGCLSHLLELHSEAFRQLK